MSARHRAPLIPWSRRAAPPKQADLMRLVAAEQLQRRGDVQVAFNAYFDLMLAHGPSSLIGNRAGFLAALCLFQLRHYSPAILLLRDDVLGADPRAKKWQSAEHHYNLGVLYQANQQPAEAVAAYQNALALDPALAAALNNLGNAYRELGDVDAAEVCYQRLRRLNPTDPEARYNLSYITLLRGQLGQGFALYEERLRCAAYMAEYARLDVTTPRLAPGDSPRRVFVHQEQGIGDTLQLLRLVPRLVALGHEVTFEAPVELGGWLQTASQDFRVIVRGQPIPEHDAHLPMMSLLYFSGILAPSQVPAPLAPQVRVRSPLWEEPGDARELIGICWAGNPKHRTDHYRSMPAAALAPLLARPHTRFVNLQLGPRGVELLAALPTMALGEGSEVLDCTAALTTFEHTAALVQRCRALVTVDTAIAHLGGTLGVPTYVLTSWLSEWRWMLDREDSPWYPSVRLVRQPTLGDWQTPVTAVRELLEVRL